MIDVSNDTNPAAVPTSAPGDMARSSPAPDRDGNTANFSASRRAGDLVFVSGQASVDEAGTIVPGTLAEEIHRSIGNLERVLAEHGASLADVVKVTSYVQDPGDIAEYNSLYRQYFSAPLPARTTIANCLNDQIKFEIDAIAHVPVAAFPGHADD